MKEKVLKFLEKNPAGKTPTEIGIALGKSYSTASPSVNYPLKSLIKEGLVVKIKIDGKVIYKINDKRK